jgi:hypothetical protein
VAPQGSPLGKVTKLLVLDDHEGSVASAFDAMLASGSLRSLWLHVSPPLDVEVAVRVPPNFHSREASVIGIDGRCATCSTPFLEKIFGAAAWTLAASTFGR